MSYEERMTELAPGARVLFYSDGLVEAHDADREMFGTARATNALRHDCSAAEVLERLLTALDRFTGESDEQEDDITLVALRRDPAGGGGEVNHRGARVLADFTVESAPGNEREAIRQMADALAGVGIAPDRLERLKTATAEATMNAMEHGNRYDPALDVRIVVTASASQVAVRIFDHGEGESVAEAQVPDIEAKLEGVQSPRGWGLFLIEEMVDSLRHSSESGRHVLELVMATEGVPDATGKS
jgi:anti-sigma regulatory factor (Ser/Thr protein kinase)